MRAGPAPDDLVHEVGLAEYLVHHHLEIVRGVPIAMQVEGTRVLEDAVHLHYAFLHPVDVNLDAALPAVLE